MPATPSNVINQNLTVGGDFAVGGNAAVTGNVAIVGNAAIVGDLIATDLIASGTSIGLITPTLGTGSLDFTEVLVPLNTGSLTTTISFGTDGLPLRSLLLGASIRVVSDFTGTTCTTGTLQVNSGSTVIVFQAPGGGFSPGSSSAGAAATYLNINVADTATFVLSSGLGNPTGGSIRVTVYFWRVTAPTS